MGATPVWCHGWMNVDIFTHNHVVERESNEYSNLCIIDIPQSDGFFTAHRQVAVYSNLLHG